MAKKKTKYIIGNWKMNPENALKAKEIFLGIRKTARELTKVKTVICPPFVYLAELNKLFYRERMALGAQDAFHEDTGSYTGEVSSLILKNMGVKYVIIGHSERRAAGETDELISKKIAKVMKSGMTGILCVGEKERDVHGNYLETMREQIKNSLAKIQKKDLERLIVAYEPVWAIGKSDKEAPQPTQIHEMAIFVRKTLTDLFGASDASSVPVLYGGSVSSKIAGPIIKDGGVDGLLVGRQSLQPEDFNQILTIANEL